jgi:hypothetical protein
MKRAFLLPHQWKIPALVMLGAFSALVIAATAYNFKLGFLDHAAGLGELDFSNDNLTDELGLSGMILSLLMLAFCAERVEDEYVASIRLRCWQWAVLVNYGLLLIGIWLVFGAAFLGILYYNMLTTLVLFLLLFYGRLHILPALGKRSAAL